MESSFETSTLLTYVGVLIASIVGYSYIKLKRLRAYYSRSNISGPRPLPIFGNMLDMLLHSRSKLEEEWRNKYGKCYVTFMGHSANLVFADADVFRDICVTNFEKFSESLTVPIATDEYQKHSLFIVSVNRWRKMRSLMMPAFTSGKIKKMFNLIEQNSQDMLQVFKTLLGVEASSKLLSSSSSSSLKEEAKVLNVDQVMHVYSMNGMASCGFGMKIDRKGETNLEQICKKNKFAAQLAGAFYFPFYAMSLPYVFPLNFLKLVLGYYNRRQALLDGLLRKIECVIKLREGKHHQYNDLLSYMHIARLGDELEFHNNQDADAESHHENNVDQRQVYEELCESVKKGNANIENCALTGVEFTANAVMLLIVGTNTTKDALTTAVYCLAHHQTVQQTLYEELTKIRTLVGNKPSFDYDSLMPNSYLDAFLSETLRILNGVLFIARRCNAEHYIPKYNITVRNGDAVQLSIHGLHTDAEYWPKPHKFDAQRFMPGNKERIQPGSYAPFGMGARQCLGMRFSLAEMKLALAQLVTSYKFTPAPNTSFPPKEGFSSFLRVIKAEFVKVEPRQSTSVAAS